MGRRSVLGLVGLGVRRVFGRLTGPAPGRMFVSLAGIAIAIAVLVVVTGLGLGLATTGTVQGEDVSYWIVPDEGDTGNTPLAFEGARLGSVHTTTVELRQDERITYATPVAIEPKRFESEDGEDAYVLALGVIPADNQSVVGMNIDSLDSSYPYYANGSYDGEWTGELVASPAAATQLNATTGTNLSTSGTDQQFRVVDVADEEVSAGIGDIPVAVVHLAELQSVTGLTESDQADQILIATDDATVREDIAETYPETNVVTRAGLTEIDTTPTSLPFAMSLGAGLTALGIGAAFITTMMGLELNATRTSLAALSAVGFSRSSVAFLLVVETLTLAVLGGIVGIGLGVGGIFLLNAGLAGVVGLPPVAVFDPILVAYGLSTATIVGLIATAYPLYIARRTTILGELTR